MNSRFWTPERRELAERMWREGAGSTATARALGDGCTRNMIIGLMRRAKVVSPNPRNAKGRPAALRKYSPARAVPAKLGSPGASPRTAPRPLGRSASPVKPTVAARAVGAIRLIDARHDQCRFIPGETCGPGTLICGDPVTAEGASYCAGHAWICYAPARAA